MMHNYTMIDSTAGWQAVSKNLDSLNGTKHCCIGKYSLNPSTLTVIVEKSTKSNGYTRKTPLKLNSPGSTSGNLSTKHSKQEKVGERQLRQEQRRYGPKRFVLTRSHTSGSLLDRSLLDSLQGIGESGTQETTQLPEISANGSVFNTQPSSRKSGNKSQTFVLRRASTSDQFLKHQTGQINLAPLTSGIYKMPTSVRAVTGPAKDTDSELKPRMSMRSLGNKVTGLIRAKNAFRRMNKVTKRVEEPEEKLNDDCYTIKEMPKQPRFASMLSAEAQYAMLKGYEDIVFDKLTVSYPECRPTLRRNKTPVTGIEVRKDCIQGEPIVEENARGSECTESNDNPTCSQQSHSMTSPPRPQSTLETTSPALTSSVIVNVARGKDRFSRRSQSLSNLVPADKQLVMTYRYQSVMDILDCLRKRDGANTLSPRLKAPIQGKAPVKEFNSWSRVWKNEFETKPINQVSHGKR